PPTAAFALADLDTTADACEDLDAYVNGKWLAAHPVPCDRTTWGSFEMLDERSEDARRNIPAAAAADASATGYTKLVRDFDGGGMDVEAINAAGLAPIQPILDRIDAIDAPEDIAAFLRDEFAAGRGDVFAFFAEPDFRNSSQMIGYAYQS